MNDVFGFTKKVARIFNLVAIAVAWAHSLSAQDIHFSQIDINPVMTNPAYMGFFEGFGRIGVAYRSQWSSVSKPYQTYLLSGEFSLKRNPYQRSGLNIGVLCYRDKAGTLAYGTTSASLLLSYYRSINGRNNNYLSMAVEVGYAQSGFDPADASLFDPSEHITTSAVSYPVVGAGLAWYYQFSDVLLTKVGLSARNLNSPNISYLGLDETHLQRHYTLYTRFEYRCWESVALLPVAVVQLQGQNSEWCYGVDARWYLDESTQRQISVAGGILMRHADAAIVNLSASYNAFTVNIAYDANYSKLLPASKSFGAIELGIVYCFNKKTAKYKPLPCPVM